MAGPNLNPDVLREAIRDAEDRKHAALVAYQAAVGELAWLREGLELMGDTDTPAATLDQDVVTGLFPAPEVKPTLRQAIATILRIQPTATWRVADLAAAIVKQGWLPDHEDVTKRVSDMAGLMVTDGLLVRVDRGTYGLSPELGAQFELREHEGQDLFGSEPERQE